MATLIDSDGNEYQLVEFFDHALERYLYALEMVEDKENQ